MLAVGSFARWRPVVGVVAVGVFAFSLTLQGAPAEKQSGPQPNVAATAGGSKAVGVEWTRVGPGIPDNLALPVLPPVKVDYRKDASSIARASGDTVAIGLPQFPAGGSVAGAACQYHLDCDDCDPCTVNTCALGTCATGDDAGQPCNVNDDCSNLDCTLHVSGIKECVNPYVPEGEPGDCNDGVWCNGAESCNASHVCIPGTEQCVLITGEICDEARNSCVDPCTSNDDCMERYPELCDGQDTCQNPQMCVGGTDHGIACTADVDCQQGVEHGVCGGLCVSDDVNPCGPGGQCREPLEGETEVTCAKGRCCDENGVCTRLTYEDCETFGDMWLAGDDLTTCSDPWSECPVYGSGIAPQGDYGVSVGPISVSPCHVLRVADDYESVLSAEYDYMSVTYMRFAAGVLPGASARFSIEFYDENGVFIEDTFYPDGTNSTLGAAVRTVDFDPALIIPTTGFVALRVQQDFDRASEFPGGRIFWLSTDLGADVGVNVDTMYIGSGAPTPGNVGNFLGMCTDGDRDGEWCDVHNADADCTGGGTCGDIDDVMAFELIATGTSAPLGACCDAGTGACTMELGWVCEAAGNNWLGEGRYCKLCMDSEGSGSLLPCTNTPYCEEFGAPGETCEDIEECTIQGCCYDNGTCVEALGLGTDCPPLTVSTGFGTSCVPNCCVQDTVTGGDNCLEVDVQLIIVPNTTQDDPVTITLTGDNATATPDDWNDKICVGGSNDGLECENDGECPPDGRCERLCGLGAFDPSGDSKDPGWWEAFSIDKCAIVRIDLCCTDPILRPAWGNLYTGCPCEEILGNVGVDPPMGLGIGTPGFARGGPFCDEDNLWQTYGPLPPGIYYYPLYSGPSGTFAAPPGGEYQMHVTVGACPEAACCVGEDCSISDRFTCEDMGGYYLARPNTPPKECSDESDNPGDPCDINADCPNGTCDGVGNIVSCDEDPCLGGACCMGPGDCQEGSFPGTPANKADCEDDGGTYVGGARCAWPGEACPVCTIVDDISTDTTYCQRSAGGWVLLADSNVGEAEEGYFRADDFVPTGDTVNTVCLRGAWIGDVENPDPDRVDCACVGDVQYPLLYDNVCESRTEDTFSVTIYEDNDGIPGTAVGSSNATGTNWTRGKSPKESYSNFDVWDVSLTLDTPITGLSPLTKPWIEIYDISDDGTTVPEDGYCYFYWRMSDRGNDYSVHSLGRPYKAESVNTYDIAFCIDFPLGTTPDAHLGACCRCPDAGLGCQEVPFIDCTNTDFSSGGDGDIWRPGELCPPAGPACPTTTAPNDLCTDARTAGTFEIFDDVPVQFDSRCALRDGPRVVTYEGEDGTYEGGFGSDLWYFYTSTCTGKLILDMCNRTTFDSAIAIYHNPSNPTVCPCPGDPGFAGMLYNGKAFDIGCSVGWIGVLGEPVVLSDRCFTVRVGGFFDPDGTLPAETGTAELRVYCTESDCFPSAPAVTDTLGPKNRYLTISAGDAGQQQAIRVKLVSLPSPFDIYNGEVMWVCEPTVFTELAGSSGSTPSPTFLGARLTTVPVFTDWTAHGMFHVFDDEIIPGGTYDIQVIEQECVQSVEENFSDPLVIVNARWGDITSDCSVKPCLPPDGVVDFIDIAALVDKFKNLQSGPIKARTDLASDVPDRIIDFVDISNVVDAFKNKPYPYDGPGLDDACP